MRLACSENSLQPSCLSGHTRCCVCCPTSLDCSHSILMSHLWEPFFNFSQPVGHFLSVVPHSSWKQPHCASVLQFVCVSYQATNLEGAETFILDPWLLAQSMHMVIGEMPKQNSYQLVSNDPHPRVSDIILIPVYCGDYHNTRRALAKRQLFYFCPKWWLTEWLFDGGVFLNGFFIFW